MDLSQDSCVAVTKKCLVPLAFPFRGALDTKQLTQLC